MRAPRLSPLSSPRRRHRVVAGLALLVGVAVVVVLVLQAGSPSPSSAANAASTASGATTVQRRNLVETDTESGTLSYSDPQTVYDRLSGTVTWLPAVGQVIKPGRALFDVNGKPVVLMDGTTPAYRNLTSSDSDGPDVLELNRDLVRLGFDAGGITVDDVWQAATTEGVDLLQESLGETETGKLMLGHVVFLPGAQLVSTVDGTVGATSGGSASGSPGSSASDRLGPPRPEFVSLTTGKPSTGTPTGPGSSSSSSSSSTTTSSSTTPQSPSGHSPGTSGNPSPGSSGNATSQTLAGLEALLREEAAQLRAQEEELRADQHSPSSGSGSHSPSSGSGSHSPSSGSGSHSPSSGSGSHSPSSGSGSHSPSSGANNPSHGSGGSGGVNPTEILQTTSTKLVVTVDLAASSQSEAVVGEHVTVELPAGNTVNGKITAVSSVAESSSSGNNGNSGNSGSSGNNGNSGSSSTIPVTITLSGHHSGAGLDQAAVSVNFAQQKANHVLSVPVTALLATGGGNYAVQAAAAPHHLIPVTTGLFAAGYVQISGPGIYPGLQVTDSQG